MKIIDLGRSRYGDSRKLHSVRDGVWSTEGFKKMNYLRVGERTDGEEGYQFLDLDGGPFLSIGIELGEEAVTHIKFEDGKYLLYTDKYDKNNSIEESQDRNKDKESDS